MEKIRAKIANGIKVIFGYGIMISLLAGGLSFFAYTAAFIIGGDAAAAICAFVYKKIYPALVILSTSMILLGLIKMYICGESEFKGGKKK